MARNKQCEGTIQKEDAPNLGDRCSRLAVNGADYCSQHGGVEQAKSNDITTVRRRLDRPRQKCTSKRRDGQPCQAFAIHGAMVCRKHGGDLPNVRAKAKERIEAMILPAWDELRKIMLKDSTSDADKLRAINILLDRSGYGPKAEFGLTHEVKPWEGLVGGVLREVPDDEDVIDAEVVHPSDEEIQSVSDQIIAEWRAENPEPSREPAPNNVTDIRSRANPPAHLR